MQTGKFVCSMYFVFPVLEVGLPCGYNEIGDDEDSNIGCLQYQTHHARLFEIHL
jgi:hypothetical protein